MLEIDGSEGEGGGQVLRSSLALSLLTGRAFRIRSIRARRRRPGLLKQHLTAVRAAACVGRARVEGDTLGSGTLVFEPGPRQGGDHAFDIGSAGSVTLVLQAVLPALLDLAGPTTLELRGGTHNPMAPPHDFLRATFLPLLARMGVRVETVLERAGFYPGGGGCLRVSVHPCARLSPLHLLERGEHRSTRARVWLSCLPEHVARREMAVVEREMQVPPAAQAIEEVRDGCGPGNAVVLEVACEHVTEVITAFGEKGVPAETVAGRAVEEARRYLASGAPVGEHLADQLLLPMVVAGGGSFVTGPLSSHTTTNIGVIQRFVDVGVECVPHGDGTWTVRMG